MSVDIQHQPERQRFVALVEGSEAVVEYERPADGTLDLVRTFVPPEGRGMGLAAKLVTAALEHARAEGLRVVPTCSYAASFLDRHPEYADLAR